MVMTMPMVRRAARACHAAALLTQVAGGLRITDTGASYTYFSIGIIAVVAILVPFLPAVRQVHSLVTAPYSALHLGKLQDADVRKAVQEHVQHKTTADQVHEATRGFVVPQGGEMPAWQRLLAVVTDKFSREPMTPQLCEHMLANGYLLQLTAASAADADRAVRDVIAVVAAGASEGEGESDMSGRVQLDQDATPSAADPEVGRTGDSEATGDQKDEE